MEPRRLDGKRAIVTGGGNGIGRACALRLAAEGASVVVADVLLDAATLVASDIASDGGRSRPVELEASDQASNDAMVAAAVEAFGGVDVLVTAAGISHARYRSGDTANDMAELALAAQALSEPYGALVDLPLGDWQEVLDVNLTGTMLAMQSAARRMVQQGSGGSIASIAAKAPEAGPMAYAVSKAGVWMLTKSAARSLAAAGVRVNAIGPGFIDTNMTRILSDMEPVRSQVLAQIPMGRLGQPGEVAAVAAFLAGEDAS
ncbi:SDR family oxidoreductase [Acidiferrimicrobium sp. IK]|uniref:SDR family NAD(P)-dependent oxidoreductase n=1 Tax=Acidiferrimicrobium sp. IK TaxID=2871700 RepID=UPI0021CAEBF2|nr:SDR family NAD(P)-dependent oxidoreductase [Acidiferrimicrobium sp. IK]MCU4187403.1 SDR family oxidoreductase [Acidiferrimicrobium sp. IK]